MNIDEFLQKDAFKDGFKTRPYLSDKDKWDAPDILNKISSELSDAGIQNLFEIGERPNYADLYPRCMNVGKLLIPYTTPENIESHVELGHWSGALSDETEISLIDACSGDGVLGTMIVGIRSKLNKATHCRCVDYHYGFGKKVMHTVENLGLQNNPIIPIEEDVDRVALKNSDRTTYLVGLKTCEGTYPIVKRFTEDDKATLPDHMCIRTCCHASIEPELRSLTSGFSKELVSNLNHYSRMMWGEANWLRTERLTDSVVYVTFRRIIDCLRADKIAKTGEFNARVIEVPTEEFGKKSSHSLVIADKI